MKKMKVCVVTGTRAEFGIWLPVLEGIERSKRLELQVVVTGMHLLPKFGRTVREIERAGIEISARVPMYREGEEAAKSLARGIDGMGRAFRELGSDLVMVLGDRLEMLAAASATLACQVPIAHLHGGEVASGQWDEQIRHAITKMAQLHFCATKTAGKRIRRMGEAAGSVHVVGAPALDMARKADEAWREAVRRMPALVRENMREKCALVVLHPGSADEELEYRRARMLVQMVVKMFPDKRVQAIGPNNDPGYQGIMRAYREPADDILLDISMPQAGFWSALQVYGLLVGNSSSGILEAATFGVPVVNIGERQAGRERNANVIDVPWEEGAIRKALERAQRDREFLRRVARRRNVYGDGRAAERIVKVLERVAGAGGVGVVKRFADR